MHAPPAAPGLSAATNGPPILLAEGLVRRFGARRAVNGVSVSLAAGDCMALFGPNGAGKTTLLRILGGLLKPEAGRATLHRHALPGDAAVRRMIGVMSHHTMLYAALTALENVRFAAECHGVRDATAAARAALVRLRVGDRADTPVRLLSRGLQQRVSIARALVHRPRLLLLDEPYTGLDDVGARALTAALRELKQDGTTMVLVTHHLGEGLALATHAGVMVNGRLVSIERATPQGFDVAGYAARYRDLLDNGVA
ncbi:MAG: heme ABC exporter ATP-binding protein CcmA [Gemmatimonas sp.]